MRKLLAIKVQSLTDLITNSSSELFQLRTSDTVEQVSETLAKITSGYCEPVLFSLEEYRRDKEKYEELENAIPYPDEGSDEEWDKYWEEIRKIKNSFPKLWIYEVVQGWFFDKEDPEHVSDAYKNYLCGDTYRYGYTPDSLQKEFRDFVYGNSFIDDDYRHLSRWSVKNEAFDLFMASHKMPSIEEITLAWSGYSDSVENLDGCILVLSEEENSMPYDTFETINEMFDGTNYHLG